MAIPLTDQEIKEKGYQIKKEDTFFMKDGKLDIDKLEEVGTSSGSSVPPYYQYEANLDKGIYIYISGNSKSGYHKKIRLKEDSFELYYEYYGSGSIKHCGKLFPKEFADGIWYWFKEEGSIEKYKNHDAPYEFSWEDVQRFLKNQKIKKEEIKNIYRGELDGVHGWEIIYKPKDFLKTDNVKVLTLDPKTGEILKEEIRDVSRELD